jgi:hypothetical protein
MRWNDPYGKAAGSENANPLINSRKTRQRVMVSPALLMFAMPDLGNEMDPSFRCLNRLMLQTQYWHRMGGFISFPTEAWHTIDLA